MSVKNVIRLFAGTAGVLLVAGAAGPGAAAMTMEDSGDVQATVRKTVRQAATATGEVTNSTMYTQVSAVGNGTKTVVVPVGSTSNRNLNQFGAFPMEGESMVVGLTVADGGGTEERTVTDADIAPMEVSVKVMLDGVEIAPEDVVGANGVLDVEYTVRNTTATTGPVTYTDVEGKEITEDVETADPFVGSLDVVLPQGFNEVTAPGATVAGNGQNETQLGYTFVLFPPLGSPEVKVGYQARIGNGQMPEAEFSFLPIVPFDNSTIAGTTEAYKGGAATGAAIFGAGDQIGENLLKLQDGAGKLVAGLGQLAAGSAALSDGLKNTAAPGSVALADGANQVADGLNQLNANVPALEEGVSDLNAGAAKLNDGAQQVAAGNETLAEGADELNANVPALAKGVGDLDAGAQSLAKGMATLSAGLGQLADSKAGLPALEAGAKQLQFGISHAPGTTGPSDPGGLLEGLTALVGGLTQASGGADQLAAGLPTAKGGVDQVKAGLDDAVSTGIPGLQGGVSVAAATPGCTGDATCTGTLSAVSAGLDTLLTETGAASAGLGQVSAGLATAVTGSAQLAGALSSQILPGAQTLEGGVKTQLKPGMDQLVAGLTKATAAVVQQLYPGSQQLLTGANQLAGGTTQLNAKVPTLASGVSQLAAGANQLADGSAQVADGTDQLAEGTETLDSKVPALASGVSKLDDGAGQVADGADKLAAGLTTAADGSGQLADGLSQAEPGGAQIEDGAGRLKEEGADELAKTGKEAQLGYAKNVALLEAAQQAGLEGAGIPFGPAEGTDVVTTAAYKMYVAGVAADTENNALKYGLGALLIAGAGGAAFAASRKVSA
jgi:putative membrane protein